jgi:putative ABC transport system permease protein
METLWQDIRFAARLLTKSPAFSTLAVLTLALGIGANSAIFSLVNAVLLRPLAGVASPDQLVSFEHVQRARNYYNFSYPDYRDYHNHSQSFSDIAAHVATPLSFTGEVTERLRGDVVSGNYFSVLGAKAALGRLLQPEDDLTVGAHPVAVLGHGFWQRAFGSDPNALGQTIKLNGHDFTVAGVAAEDFAGTSTGASIDVWLPMAMQPQAIPRMSPGILEDRSAGWISVFGRLGPGIRLEQAQAEIATIASRIEQAYPETNSGRGAALAAGIGLSSPDRASFRQFLGLLLAAVALLLLIACGNVANLLMLRAASRRREIAVRLALGASRSRLVRQLLTEGVMLSLIAGVLGLLLAPWTADLILTFQQPAFGLRGQALGPDLGVLGFTLALSLLTGILFGLVPALQASKTNLVISLKDGASSGNLRKSRLQSLLVVSQVALSLVLLVGAGLAVRTMQKILAIDRGFDIDSRLLLSLDLSIQGYSQEAGSSFYEQLIKRLETIPGVKSASFAKTVPPNDWSDRMSVFYEGQEPPQEMLRGNQELGVRTDVNRVAPRYFQTLGIPLLRGRDFTEADKGGAPAVAIINEKLAEKLWPGESALGKRLAAPALNGPPLPAVEIVGIARDTRYRTLLADAPPILYFPVLQAYDGRTTLVVHTTGDGAGLAQTIRGEVAAIDRNLPLFAVKSMSEQVAATLWQQRMAAGLIGLFGALALVLAAVGLYGIVSHSVAGRTREIGIRMALGANRTNIVGLIVRQALALALAGVSVGVVAALVLTRLMTGLLYEVRAADPTTFAVAAMLLIAVSLLASFTPARRATRVDPTVALRYE